MKINSTNGFIESDFWTTDCCLVQEGMIRQIWEVNPWIRDKEERRIWGLDIGNYRIECKGDTYYPIEITNIYPDGTCMVAFFNEDEYGNMIKQRAVQSKIIKNPRYQ
jgi:hypothetical protein